MPIGFVRLFSFWLLPKPHPSSAPHFTFLALIFLFLLVRKHLRTQPVLLNLDLIYSTNVWETWELDCCFFCLVCLRCRLCLENDDYICKVCPALPLFHISPRKGHSEASCREQRSWNWHWLRKAPGPGVKGGDWNSCLISILLIKQVLVGFLKILFLNGGINALLYFGGGWDLWL